MEINFGVRIIKTIRDVDFALFPDSDVTDDNIVFRCKEPVHGTIIYVAGLIVGDEDGLMCMGAEDGTTDFKVAIYGPFLEFEKGWLKLLGRVDDAYEIEKMQEFVRGGTS